MRAYELMENEDDFEEKFDLIWNDIEKNCSEILSIYRKHNGLLYRGMQNKPLSFIGQSRSDRNPAGSSKEFHQAFNDAFQRAGFTINRTNCYFATGNLGTAQYYGNAYVIFPFDGFKYIWNPEIDDPFNDMPRPYGFYSSSYGEKFSSYADYLDSVVSDYTSVNLPQAIKSENEIMMQGKYWALNYNEFYVALSKKLDE